MAFVWTSTVTPAQATTGTSATIAPSLSPNRLGAKGALTLTIRYAGGEFGVPAPVRRSILRFPAGLRLEIPKLRSCTSARLEADGPSGCPRQSQIGSGRALVQSHTGSETISENVVLQAFLGPPQNLQPTVEILAHGSTPIDQRVIINGIVRPARPPYGEELAMSLPATPTLPSQPDASVVTFSLTVGMAKRYRWHDANTIRVPSRCPAGGFPFAAEFTYADGSGSTAQTTAPCPL
jgi:hypothetical protein